MKKKVKCKILYGNITSLTIWNKLSVKFSNLLHLNNLKQLYGNEVSHHLSSISWGTYQVLLKKLKI